MTFEPEPRIVVDRLTHRYDRGRGLSLLDVSFAVQDREFLSIIGPSGCGKTTILNVLAGLVAPTSGRALIAGSLPSAGRADIAYMFARDALLPWRTALDNVEFGMELRGLSRTSRRERARELLSSVGLASHLSQYPSQLSRGMRQRVALCRTFALDASILLMDEPFGALDAQTRVQLQDVLLGLWQRERRTVVFVTHDLAEAVALSDRVIVMRTMPGSIHVDVPIGLPRPRSAALLQADAAFHQLYARLWSALEASHTGMAG